MKKLLLVFSVLIVLVGSVSALDCVVPTNGMVITEDTTFCKGIYFFNNSINVANDGLILDCNNSRIISNTPWSGVGIRSDSYNNVTIKNCQVQGWLIGVRGGGNNLIIENNKALSDVIGFEIVGDSNIMKKNDARSNWFLGFSITSSNGHFLDNYGDGTTYNNRPASFLATNTLITNNNFLGGSVEIKKQTNIIRGNNFFNSMLVAEGCGGETIIESNTFNSTKDNNFDIWLVPTCGANYSINNNKLFGEKHTGIVLWSVSNSSIINNFYESSDISSKFLDFRELSFESLPYNNLIIMNDIYRGYINDPNESLNIYCVNGIGNSYFDGATGPICPDSDSDGINDYFDKCPNTTSEQIAYGCSCLQILELKGMSNKDECNKGLIDNFIELKGWAKDLFS